MHDGIKFGLIFFGILFIVWLVGNGPARFEAQLDGEGTQSFFGPLIPNFSAFIPRINFDSIGGGFGGGGTSGGGGDSTSSFSDSISLERGTAGYYPTSKGEYLTIRVGINHSGKTLLSGWELRSTPTGRSVTIPKAVILPFSGQTNSENFLFVEPGDVIHISSGRSPIGYSFRVNKCTGYFEQNQDFAPTLPIDCPRPIDEKLPEPPDHLSDSCMDFLERTPRCTVPRTPTAAEVPYSCAKYVAENINYNKCIEKHKDDPDFYKKEWRVYLNYDEKLWKDRREIIRLFDLTKNVVETLTY